MLLLNKTQCGEGGVVKRGGGEHVGVLRVSTHIMKRLVYSKDSPMMCVCVKSHMLF